VLPKVAYFIGQFFFDMDQCMPHIRALTMIKLATHEKKFKPRHNISSKIQALEVLE
jgi:hypothetical protein